MTTPDKEEMPTKHRNAGPCLREALALVAGGFEGEGLEIENEWRRSIARNALNGLPLSEYQVSVARRYLSTLPVNDRQTSDDVGILRALLEEELVWHEERDKSLSKQPRSNQVVWRRAEHQERIDVIRAALKGVPQPAKPEPEARIVTSHALPVTMWDSIATAVVKRVAELPDRSSPDNWPEAMLVTSEELHDIIMSEFDSEVG